MIAMGRLLLVLIVGAVLTIPGVAIVQALDAETFGYYVLVPLVALIASRFDRERFWGPDTR
jgi:hypothetical protein